MAGSGASPHSPDSPQARAEHFIWLTARVLEQRRFAFHFLGGNADAVEAALSAYEGADGGYGHALEPDLRGPVSQPLHTAHALRVLDSVGRLGGRRVERVCRYLTDVSTRDGALPALHPSQRGYPAAPFVPVVDDPPSALLATGPVVGLLHRNQVWHAWLFRATDFCWAAVDALETSHPYEVEAAVAFLDGAPDRARAEAAADRLGRLVRDQGLAVLDPARLDQWPLSPGYAPGEHHFPHDYARARVAGPALVHRRGDGALAGSSGGGAAGGRRLADPLAGVGAGYGSGVPSHGDDRGVAYAARLRPRCRLTGAGPRPVGVIRPGPVRPR